MIVYTIFIVLLLVMLPGTAHAWGPGTHIELALSLLEKASIFTPAVASVISGRKKWFLYGSVAADIVLVKKYSGPIHHCHNWSVGRLILDSAVTDRERAAAYGYLSHLAADIVAHNYYIPAKIIESYKTKLLSHTYWEMMFDLHVRPEAWGEMAKIVTDDFSPFDRLLGRSLKKTLFSFRTNKQIFSGILGLQQFKQFRRTIQGYSKKSRYQLDNDEIQHYMQLANRCATDYLSSPSSNPCFACDPTGAETIGHAKRIRRQLNRIVGKDNLKSKEVLGFISESKRLLFEGVCRCLSSSPKQ